jgi:hypothetical protein
MGLDDDGPPAGGGDDEGGISSQMVIADLGRLGGGYDSDSTIEYVGPLCRTTHRWEECDSGNYVFNGVLCRRRCYKCEVKFAERPKKKKAGEGEEPEPEPEPEAGPRGKKLYVSRRNLVSHCMDCKVCVCNRPCRGNFDIATPSPRKVRPPGRMRQG